MTNDSRSMLEGLLHEFDKKFSDQSESWDKFIDFLGTGQNCNLLHQINHHFEWLFNDNALLKSINRIYNPNILRIDYHDHLGEMYKHRFSNPNRNGERILYLIPMNQAIDLAKIPSESNHKLSILDPDAKTGRLLMAAFKNSPQARFYGVEKNIRLYRIAYINLAIHNIPAYLLNAEKDRHEIDIAKPNGRYNWQFANKWYSQINKLRLRSK